MAKRLLLTLLALLAGLAAQLTPAQARSSAAVDVEIGASTGIVLCARPSVAGTPLPSSRKWARHASADETQPAIGEPFVPVATVLPGIDRARE